MTTAAIGPSWLPQACLVVVGMRAEAALLPDGTRTLCTGGDPQRLAAALESMRDEVRAVLSFGIAGGLDPALRAGALLVATRVRGASGAYPAEPGWGARLAAATGARPACLAGATAILGTPAEKAALRAKTGAAAVDLESEAAAHFAARRGLPFAALRAVADTAGDALPRCAAVGLTPDGQPAVARVLLALARRPGELPALLAIARASRLALRELAAATLA